MSSGPAATDLTGIINPALPDSVLKRRSPTTEPLESVLAHRSGFRRVFQNTTTTIGNEKWDQLLSPWEKKGV